MPLMDRDAKNAYARAYYANGGKDKHLVLVKKNKQARVSRQRELFDMLKSEPCMDCGNSFPPVCMDFDHRPDEDKKFNLGSATAKKVGWSVLLEEIAKCDVVCANCHRLRTAQRLREGLDGLTPAS